MVGDNILYRGVKDGKRIRQKIKYKPKLYVKNHKGNKPTKWTTIKKEPVEEMIFPSIREARDFVKTYEDVSNFPIYGNTRYDYAFISDMYPNDIDWDISNLCVAYIDIEVGSENGFPEPKHANEEITAITLHMNNKYYVFCCGSYKKHRDDVLLIKCDNEIELLEKFLDTWTHNYPDIVSGWFIKNFDFPYLINRMTRLFGEEKSLKLSPWGKISSRNVSMDENEEEIVYSMMGISMLDYRELYKKFSNSPQEKYSLDHIAFVELGERKLDYSEYETLHTLYLSDYQKFIEYNVRDVELVERLEDKLRLLELAMTLAYDAKVNYEDVFSQVRMWDTITYNTLKKKHIAVPPKRISRKDNQYAGAFVKNPLVGMHEWVASFDLNSLYPHLIMMYNLSPEMLMDFNELNDELQEHIASCGSQINVDSLLEKRIDTSPFKKYKVALTPNAQLFNIEHQGFLSEVMETMYEDRALYKKKAIEAKKRKEEAVSESEKRDLEKQIARYNNLQLAKKVTLNSAYGAIGNQYFRFFDIRIAEAITLSGQLAARWIEHKLNSYLNKLLKTDADYVIASDTDSIYLNLGPLINKVYQGKDMSDKHKVIRFMDKICEDTLQPFIDDSYQELADYVNAYAQKMKMKREALADKAVWTSKKHYIINIYNNEGVEYKTPKLKIVGMEAIKSSTPAVCREKIRKGYELIITQNEDAVIKFIDEFRDEIKTLPPEDIAFPRGVNGLAKYADSKSIFGFKTPIHVRGSLIFNHYIRELKLTKKYQQIKEGEKIKFIYLKKPNPMHSDVISFINTIPKEFDLQQYLDYNTQFEKAFLEPLKVVLDAIGWRTERGNSLEDFFS